MTEERPVRVAVTEKHHVARALWTAKAVTRSVGLSGSADYSGQWATARDREARRALTRARSRAGTTGFFR